MNIYIEYYGILLAVFVELHTWEVGQFTCRICLPDVLEQAFKTPFEEQF